MCKRGGGGKYSVRMFSFVIHSLSYVLLTLLNYVAANTEIWRYSIADIKPSKWSHHNSISNGIIQPFQINTFYLSNVTSPQFFSLNSTHHDYESIYLKLSWSAIDPIESFSNVNLYSMGNIGDSDFLLLSIEFSFSHDMIYTKDNPLMINLYVDDSGNLITHDLYPIITYITIVVVLLTLIFWKFGGIETLLFNFI